MSLTKRRSVVPKRKKQSPKKKISAVLSVIFLVIIFAALAVRLNEVFFKLGFIPTSADIAHFFGIGEKPYAKPLDGEAAVYFIDVGQGDCELIATKDYSVLIDCGSAENADKVIGFINGAGIKRLDLIIATHPHADHIGGMYKILGAFDVGLLLSPELPEELSPETVYYSKMLAEADMKKIPIKQAKSGDSFSLGENGSVEIIAPVYNDYDDMNDFSIAARYVHGENEFLFAGDLGRGSELDILESKREISSDVIKIAHHGSASSSSEDFLEKVKPRIAVIEVGEINDFGHPREEVFERLEKASCKEVYTTSMHGNILILSNGADLRIETEKTVDKAA